MIDGKMLRSAGYLLITAVCSLFGIIHSPFRDPRIAPPHHVIADLKGAAEYQTPYHWATAYTIMAVLVAAVGLLTPATQPPKHKESEET
jgi:hypothetical protein